MDISIIVSILATLQSMPVIGPPIVFVLKLVLPVSILISAFVMLWQSVVGFLDALGGLPYCGFFKVWADKLKTKEVLIEGFLNKYIVPFLKTLSVIPVPKLSKSAEKV